MTKELNVLTISSLSHISSELDLLGKESSHIKLSSDMNPADSDYIVIDDSMLLTQAGKSFCHEHSEKIFLLSSSEDSRNVVDILSHYKIKHLVGANSKYLSNELKHNMRGQKPYHGGVSQHFDREYLNYKASITNSDSFHNLVDTGISKFEFNSFFTSPREYLKVVANELIMNAFYNAPSGKNDVSRDEKIEFDDEQAIEFEIAANDEFILLSVVDKFGTLTRETLISSLKRSFEDKTPENKAGGAGLGLYLAFSHSNQFIANIIPGKSTEIISIIESNKRYKKYKERITSLHFHSEVSYE